MQLFGMKTIDYSPSCNIPPHDVQQCNGDKKMYFDTVMNKFVSEYLVPNQHAPVSDQRAEQQQPTDLVREYSLCLLRLFFIFVDLKQTIKIGNGDRLASLHKVLLKHFKSDAGHNSYAVQMFIGILQNEVFLNEAQAHQTRWASTANLRGGLNNLEIDLLQKNLNREIKKGLKE